MMLRRSVRLARRCCGAALQDHIPWYVRRKIAREASSDGVEGAKNELIARPRESDGFGYGARVAMQGHFERGDLESLESGQEDESEDESESESLEDLGYLSDVLASKKIELENFARGELSDLQDSEELEEEECVSSEVSDLQDSEELEEEFEEEDHQFEEDEEEVEDELQRQFRSQSTQASDQLLLIAETSSDSEPEDEAPPTSYLHKLTVREVAKILRKLRGIDLKILNVQARCQWTDYMVFVSGKSTRHIRGMADSIVARVKKKSTEDNHLEFPSVEGRACEHWMVVDCGSIVVHVFSEEARARYNLEQKWGGEEVVMDEQKKEEEERDRERETKEQGATAATVLGQETSKKKKKKKASARPASIAPLVLC
ncbi:uncharacterized protein LOC9629054 [Selaginella moellendorffii]|nr:uncharacterized protein LOC9629054 [Selaginella moellendorffii]|eukprot:XP_002975007.2 uncharacterized protein LOC9629054 [Selaginella moellendorffii]